MRYGIGQFGWTPTDYDADEGRVILERYADGVVREATMVRKGLTETAIREAAIIELRRLGYTVIPPSPD